MVARTFLRASPCPAARTALGLLLVATASCACGAKEATEEPTPDPAEEASSPAAPSGRSGRATVPAAQLTGEEPVASEVAGALHGTILFRGTVPERFELGAAKSPECKHHQAVDQRSNVVLVADGKLANAYVYVKSGYDKARIPPATGEPVTLEQKGCMYVPRVLALRVGQALRVTNEDPTNHNVHTRPKRNDALNRNMGAEQPALELRFEEVERPVPFACDVHPWMGAAVFVEEHPWFAVTDEHGAFSIRDVPPGEYVVEAAHESLGKVAGSVTVTAGKSAGFTLTLGK